MNKKIVNTVFKAVGLAMGVAVVALSVMDKVDVKTAVLLLGIGLVCNGISDFND